MKTRFVSFGKLLVLGSVVAAQVFASGCSKCGSSSQTTCSTSSAAVISTSTGNCNIDYSKCAPPAAAVSYPAARTISFAAGVVPGSERIVPGSERVISRQVVATSQPIATAPAPVAVAAPFVVYSVPPVAAPVPMNIARPRVYAAGAPIYYTPGGTPISAYVPGPAVGSQLRGSTGGPVLAEPTISTSIPVRSGNVHYTTGATCNVTPTRGESVVWTSGF